MQFGPRALIDWDALRHNLQRARQAAPGTLALAIIKANGYGHGMLRVAEALKDDADGFGVARTSEGVRLREAGFQQPITILGGFNDRDELEATSQHRLNPAIHSPHQIELLEQHPQRQPISCWIKIDTGMHRLGLEPEQVQETTKRLTALPHVADIRYMSHLACADDPTSDATNQQQQLFTKIVPAKATTSLANSAGILAWPTTHADWIRPGIMLYGASPLLGHTSEDDDLRPVMTLETRLVSIKRVKKGQSIGYGASWTCPEEMRVGIAAIGYGDGYPRHAPSGTPTLIHGHFAPLVGRVSMDMIAIDLRNHPEAGIGDRVILWGKGLPAEIIAEKAGTIAYELFCGVTRRVNITN